jgi:hypothetical protein
MLTLQLKVALNSEPNKKKVLLETLLPKLIKLRLNRLLPLKNKRPLLKRLKPKQLLNQKKLSKTLKLVLIKKLRVNSRMKSIRLKMSEPRRDLSQINQLKPRTQHLQMKKKRKLLKLKKR